MVAEEVWIEHMFRLLLAILRIGNYDMCRLTFAQCVLDFFALPGFFMADLSTPLRFGSCVPFENEDVGA